MATTWIQLDGEKDVRAVYLHVPEEEDKDGFQWLSMIVGDAHVSISKITPDALEKLADDLKVYAVQMRRRLAIEGAAQAETIGTEV